MSVTVVIPCFNAEKTLRRCIASVHTQGTLGIEVIVIVDGSTDGTEAVAQTCGPNVRVFAGPNLGACAARNRGLRAANGRYILFLDADDALEAGFLSSLLREAHAGGLELALGQTKMRIGGIRARASFLPAGAEGRQIIEYWLKGTTTQTGAMLWDTAALRSIGGWNEAVLRGQDNELVLRAVTRGVKARVCEAGFVIYDNTPRSTRISGSRSIEKLRSHIEWNNELLKRLREISPDLMILLAPQFYSFSVEAFALGDEDLGSSMIDTYREIDNNETKRERIESRVRTIAGWVRLRRWLVTLPGGSEARKSILLIRMLRRSVGARRN